MSTQPPACPICQEPAIHWGRSQRAGTTEATYLCVNEHGWLTKWVTP